MTSSAYDDNESDDGALARAHLDGDPHAFATLYRRYYPDVVAYLRRRGHSHAQAEDVAQETLARALRYLDGFDPERPLWPWLRTIASRVAADEAARHAAEVPIEAVDDLVAADEIDALAARVALVQSLAHLSPRHRRVIEMRYIEDVHPAEVAAAFGMTRNTLEQLLWRARRSLARVIDGESRAPLALPFLPRARRFFATADARFDAVAQAAMVLGGNAVAGAALAIGGIGIIGGALAAPPHTRTEAVASVGTVPFAGRDGADATRAAAAPHAVTASAPAVAATQPGRPHGPSDPQPPRIGSRPVSVHAPGLPGGAHATTNTDPSGRHHRGEFNHFEVMVPTPWGPVGTEGHTYNTEEGGLTCKVNPALCE